MDWTVGWYTAELDDEEFVFNPEEVVKERLKYILDFLSVLHSGRNTGVPELNSKIAMRLRRAYIGVVLYNYRAAAEMEKFDISVPDWKVIDDAPELTRRRLHEVQTWTTDRWYKEDFISLQTLLSACVGAANRGARLSRKERKAQNHAIQLLGREMDCLRRVLNGDE